MSVYLFELIFMGACLVLDIFLFFKIKRPSMLSAGLIFGFWLLVAVVFFISLYFGFNQEIGMEFLTGYVLERSLGLDNLFVFVVIFSSFKITETGKERVLFWGIMGAIVLRIIFIYIGATLIEKFAFMMYIFGGFLLLTGIKLLFKKESEGNVRESLIVRFFKSILPFSSNSKTDKFYEKKKFTPLFLVLLFVAFVDVVFAIDSIPAIFGITNDPFVVLTANFFSLVGFRAMFFLVSHLMDYFYYIKYALSGILIFIGIKMLLLEFMHVPVVYSLGFIFASIAIAIYASLLKMKK